MRRILLVLALFVVGAPLLLAGCGESDSTADATAAPTKAEFVARANAICAKTNQELAKTAEDFTKEQSPSGEVRLTAAQATELSKLALPAIVRQFEQIRALGVPAGNEEQVAAILSAADKAVEEGERDPAVIYGANGGAFAKANRLSADFGLSKCSE